MKRPRSPVTAYKATAVAAQPFNWAAATDQFRGKVPPLQLPAQLRCRKPAPRRYEVPSFEEGAKAVTAALGWMRRSMILLYYSADLRVDSQVMRLEWKHFNLVEDHASLDVDPVLAKTTSERVGRRTPISSQLRAELRVWAAEDGVDSLAPPRVGERRFVVAVGSAGRRRQKTGQEFRGRDAKRCWKRAGVWLEAFGQPSRCFRKMLREGLLYGGAEPQAVNRLVGYKIDSSSGLVCARPDRWLMEKMREAVAKIPAVQEAGL